MISTDKHILIIEDCEETARLLSNCLGTKGFRVSWVADGRDGLKAVQNTRPDLVILDLGLPGLPGEEVCRGIKDSYDRELREIPILVVTGRNSEADRVIVRAYGASSYITKPFRLEKVMRAVDELLGLSV